MDALRPVSMLVNNERGVLARVAGLFARRGFNITSLAVGETESRAYSRITAVVAGDDATLEQVVKQLDRLVSVCRVMDLSNVSRVERGLALIKVKAAPDTRRQVMDLAEVFNARIDHVDHLSLIVEVTGNRDKIGALIDLLRPFGIIEMARTGQIVLSRHGDLNTGVGEEMPAAVPVELLSESEPDLFELHQPDQGA
jgi:acetolactate synthase-1/3 small subunit